MRSSLFYPLLMVSASMLFLLSGCAKIRPVWTDLKSSFKSEEQPLSTLEQTRKRYSCSQGDTRFFVEKSDIIPSQVEPGDKIKHVVQYALCAPSDSVTFQGMVSRKIKFKGKERKITSEAETETFKAGVWTFTAYIEVPDNAPDGVYTLETIIRFEDKQITRSGVFTVRD